MNQYEQAANLLANIDALIASAHDDEDVPAFAQNATSTPVSAPPRVITPLVGFPDRHKRNLDLFGDEWHEAYKKALSIVEAGGIVIAFGKRGTGKTQIAYEIARNANFIDAHYPQTYRDGFHLHTNLRSCLYIKAMDIFIDLKNGFGRPNEPSEKEVITKLIEAAFLVIDEAHVRGETKYEDDKLTHIIDKRYDAMRATMLITNLEKKDFAATLSPSILSRIAEIGGGIECNWKSYRTKKTL